MTKPPGEATSRAASALRAESGKRAQVGAILSKCGEAALRVDCCDWDGCVGQGACPGRGSACSASARNGAPLSRDRSNDGGRYGPRKSGLPDLHAFERRSRVNPRSVSAAHHSAKPAKTGVNALMASCCAAPGTRGARRSGCIRPDSLGIVIAGLDPAIHRLRETFLRWTTELRSLSSAFQCASRINPTCVVKPAGDADREAPGTRGVGRRERRRHRQRHGHPQSWPASTGFRASASRAYGLHKDAAELGAPPPPCGEGLGVTRSRH